MHCKHCDYPLWNLRSRQCPECGTGFVPSEFRFALNTVRFCCPHCEQDYYGTGVNGHLEPRAFACVGCGRPMEMDEMVLLPTAGVDERLTKADANPWLDLDRKFLGRWFATLFHGACRPTWLLRVTPVDSGGEQAWAFAAFSHLAIGLVMLMPLLLLTAVAGGFFGFLIALLVGTAIGTAVWLGLWVLTAHGVLWLGGKTEGGMGRTAQALGFTCGPQLVLLTPCLGIMYGWVGTIWWIIVAGFALATAQKVSGLRAAMAVGVLPLVCGVLAVGGAVTAMVGAVSSAPSFQVSTGESVTRFRDPLRAAAVSGAWPAHAGQFLIDGPLWITDYISPMSATTRAHCRIDTITLADWEGLAPEARQGMVDRAVAAMPAGVVAHRLGDFVLTYHGIDPAAPDAGLWLVVEAWDPTTGAGRQSDIFVLTVGGEVRSFPRDMVGPNLNTQNALRRSLGLAPLPDPFSVRAGRPAAADLPEDPG